jgi:hypothetical protein
MAGGPGNDSYRFSNAWGQDEIIEYFNEGEDTLDLGNITDTVTVELGVGTTSGSHFIRHEGNRLERILANPAAAGVQSLKVAAVADLVAVYAAKVVWGNDAPVYFHGFNQIEIEASGGAIHVAGELTFAQGVLLTADTLQLGATIRAGYISISVVQPLVMSQPAGAAQGENRPLLLQAGALRIEHAGGVGNLATPLITQVDRLEVITRGSDSNAAGVYLLELDGLTVGNVEIPGLSENRSGIETRGGDVFLMNLTGVLVIAADVPAATGIEAWGGDIVLTTDRLSILAPVRSWYGGITGGSDVQRGTLVLQPLNPYQSIGVGRGASGSFFLTHAMLEFIIDGFEDSVPGGYDGITIGRADGRHIIEIGSYAYRDSVTFRAPRLGGGIFVVGTLSTIAEAQLRLIGPTQ